MADESAALSVSATMFRLLQNLKGAISALCDSLQTTAVQLFTNPTQLSSGDVIVLGFSALVVGATLWYKYRGCGIKKDRLKAEFTPGEVYVCASQPKKIIPSLAPFVMKLQTYLRMADIPYEVVTASFLDFGPKGKSPWIEYNGEAMGDSGLIIEFLNKEKGVDLNKNLSDTDKAVSRAFTKMLEENTYWGLVHERGIDNSGRLYFELLKLPWYVRLLQLTPILIKKYAKKMIWAHGIGRHSMDELEGIIEKDLKALSTFLGTKPYLMGEEPTEVDAAVFGQLSEFVWTVHNPDHYLHRIVTKDCPNLQAYSVRMKERYWPDWDQLTGNTKKDQ